jgi:ABC-type antimicrobial peptide transport system permease subunit
VSRRRTDIGIRLALGATSRHVVQLVLRRVLLLVFAGIALGVVVSMWASRFVATLLYGLEPRDPATLVAGTVILTLVAVAAGWLPTRRAARLDPSVTLRYE